MTNDGKDLKQNVKLFDSGLKNATQLGTDTFN